MADWDSWFGMAKRSRARRVFYHRERGVQGEAQRRQQPGDRMGGERARHDFAQFFAVSPSYSWGCGLAKSGDSGLSAVFECRADRGGLVCSAAFRSDRSGAHQFLSKDEERRGQQAAGGPDVVPIWFFLQIEPCEGDEDSQRDDFLKNLELPDIHDLMTDAVGGDLDQVFEQRDAPADQCGDQPWFLSQVLQVTVPGDGHEDIAEQEQSGGR